MNDFTTVQEFSFQGQQNVFQESRT